MRRLLLLLLPLLCAPTFRDNDADVRAARVARPSDCDATDCPINGGGTFYDGMDNAWDRIGTAGNASKLWYATNDRGAWFLVCEHCGCGDPITLGSDSSFGALQFDLVSGGGGNYNFATPWQDPDKDCDVDPDPDCVDDTRPPVKLCGPYLLSDGTFPPWVDPYPMYETGFDGTDKVVISIGKDAFNDQEIYKFEECGEDSSPDCCLDHESKTILDTATIATVTSTTEFIFSGSPGWTPNQWTDYFAQRAVEDGQTALAGIESNTPNTLTMYAAQIWEVGDDIDLVNQLPGVSWDGDCHLSPDFLVPYDRPALFVEVFDPSTDPGNQGKSLDDLCDDGDVSAKAWRTGLAKFRTQKSISVGWQGIEAPPGFPERYIAWAALAGETWSADANKDPTRSNPCGLTKLGWVLGGGLATTIPGCPDMDGPWATDMPDIGGTCFGASTTYLFVRDPEADGRWPLVATSGTRMSIVWAEGALRSFLNLRSVGSGQGGVQ